MILSRDAYERWRVDDSWARLSRLSPSESFAVGIALCTSSIAATTRVTPEPRHLDFARVLGVSPDRLDPSRFKPRS